MYAPCFTFEHPPLDTPSVIIPHSLTLFSLTLFSLTCQLAHSGRKGSVKTPAQGRGQYNSKADGGWDIIAPSPVPWDAKAPTPKEMTKASLTCVCVLSLTLLLVLYGSSIVVGLCIASPLVTEYSIGMNALPSQAF